MATTQKLCRILGIRHPDDQATCIGYGIKRPVCGNPVAAASRDAAVRNLTSICTALQRRGSSQRDMLSKLNDMAKLLHCKRNHQWQADDTAREWSKTLRDYAAERDEDRRHRQRSSRSQRSSTPSSHRSRSERLDAISDRLDSLEQTMEREFQKLERVLASRRTRGSSTRHVSDSETSNNESEDDTDSNDSDNDDSDDGSDADESDEGSNADDSDEGSNTGDSDSDDEPPARTRRTATSRRTSPASSSTTTTSSSSSIREECGICLSALPRQRSASVWRCGTCRNATHMDCFDEWMANSPEQRMRCIYCRTNVSVT